MIIRQGSLQEAKDAMMQLNDTSEKLDFSFERRFAGKPYLVLLAEHEGSLCGVNVGYQLDDECFYGWFEGVATHHKHEDVNSVKKALLLAQEDWVRTQGYKSIRLKSQNALFEKVSLLFDQQYQVEHLEKNDVLDHYYLHFVKRLP